MTWLRPSEAAYFEKVLNEELRDGARMGVPLHWPWAGALYDPLLPSCHSLYTVLALSQTEI